MLKMCFSYCFPMLFAAVTVQYWRVKTINVCFLPFITALSVPVAEWLRLLLNCSVNMILQATDPLRSRYFPARERSYRIDKGQNVIME